MKSVNLNFLKCKSQHRNNEKCKYWANLRLKTQNLVEANNHGTLLC